MDLDLKKAQVELARVAASRGEMELKIMERQAEIKRLEDNIKIQLEKEEELKQRVKEFQ